MLGAKIREIRQQNSLTLNELAEKTQLTASYLSQIERDLIDPSLSSLRKIAMALKVPIYTFLTHESKQHVLTKATQRRKLALPNSSIIYEFISPMASDKSANIKMEMVYFKLEAKSWSSEEFIIHAADECIFILKGQLEVYLDKEKYVLEEGDSIYIIENIPHRFYNPRNEVVVGISNICPPIY
ncbi:transcriptional regulator with XRE-family HTH domain [Anaerosolibacter carboniphilus]|uniref:Transcriptional regulator with XRE-family HTH domain n=1 Tax=Anaerosolibacter carboniphilus TaxID=1417629 RepID=A0A841KVX5_9FIRM|nr:cupin domain-containing protein [Anaerosolibacter carboniphilus]MBB6217836.1 transcriptional regulator with XRE-family HTH domain [Anaerosolibacter carboniphilus]